MTKTPGGDPSNQGDARTDEFVAADDTVIGRAFRGSMVVVGLLGVIALLIVWWAGRSEPVAPPKAVVVTPPQRDETPTIAPIVTFTDITEAAGIDFIHINGATGDKLLPETMGGGAAFLDFDNDGDQDLLFVQSNHWPESSSPADVPPVVLYRNDGAGKFSRVELGLSPRRSFFGMGVAVGDYDNDGWTDVFVSGIGLNLLLHNTGGSFQEIAAESGVSGLAEDWGTSSAFVDYDNDGFLDLFVCNYVRWSRAIDFEVDYRLVGVGRAYGPPMNFEGSHSYLYRNNGDGTFSDVSQQAGVQITNPATGVPVGKALGVSPMDIDRDGWIDLVVANDTVGNFLLRNQRDGTFADVGFEYGLAFDRNGSATGAMGIDGGYYRNDDDLGFFIGNFANEMTSLYVSQGDPTLFSDEAIVEGIGAPTRLMLSFGLFLFDYDLDGRLDLLQSNGHLEEEINKVQPSQRYEQPPQLFWNQGVAARGCFVAVDNKTTGDLANPIVGRGSAYADIDGDGDLDVLMTQIGRKPVLLRNDQNLGHRWIRIKLIGIDSNRDAIGATVELVVGDTTLRRRVMPTRSYLSQSELPVTFGLGKFEQAVVLKITWPRGLVETIENPSVNTTLIVREGKGVVRPGT